MKKFLILLVILSGCFVTEAKRWNPYGSKDYHLDSLNFLKPVQIGDSTINEVWIDSVTYTINGNDTTLIFSTNLGTFSVSKNLDNFFGDIDSIRIDGDSTFFYASGEIVMAGIRFPGSGGFSGDYNDLTNQPNIPDSVAAHEMDPVYSVSVASGITGTDTANWNDKISVSGTPSQGYIAIFNSLNQIIGYSNFKFTTNSGVPGYFYPGSTRPTDGTNTMNYNGVFCVTRFRIENADDFPFYIYTTASNSTYAATINAPNLARALYINSSYTGLQLDGSGVIISNGYSFHPNYAGNITNFLYRWSSQNTLTTTGHTVFLNVNDSLLGIFSNKIKAYKNLIIDGCTDSGDSIKIGDTWFEDSDISSGGTETDPVFSASVASEITESDTVRYLRFSEVQELVDSLVKVKWDSLRAKVFAIDTSGWNLGGADSIPGEWVIKGGFAYLSLGTRWEEGAETDPIFSASAASGITSTDITNWNNGTGSAKIDTTVAGNDTVQFIEKFTYYTSYLLSRSMDTIRIITTGATSQTIYVDIYTSGTDSFRFVGDKPIRYMSTRDTFYNVANKHHFFKIELIYDDFINISLNDGRDTITIASTGGGSAPIAVFDLEQNVNDSKGNYNGTAIGEVSYENTITSFDNYYIIFGSNEGFSVSSVPFTSTFSISGWCQLPSLEISHCIFDGLSSNDGFKLDWIVGAGTAADSLRIITGNGTTTDTLYSTHSNTWTYSHTYFWCFTVNRTTGEAHIYVGESGQDNLTDVTGNGDILTDFETTLSGRFGLDLNNGGDWGAYPMDKIQIYTYVLNSTQISYLYTAVANELGE